MALHVGKVSNDYSRTGLILLHGKRDLRFLRPNLFGRAPHAGLSTLISANEPLMVINAACLRTLSPLSMLKHALGRKCSLMATPS